MGMTTSTDSVKPKKTKKTEQDILNELEEKGISFTKLGLGPWSHSKVKVLRSCPLKFYLQYILKKKPEGVQEVSLVTEVGKAAHRILEFNLGGKTLKDAYRLTRAEFKETIDDEQWVEHIESVEYSIQTFKSRIEDFENRHGVRRILQELRIGCTKEWEPTGFFADDVYYRGVIDLAIQLDNGDLILVDHKYGTVSAMGLRNFKDQLNNYKVLFDRGIEPITGAMAGIHHIKEGELSMGEYYDVETIRGTLLNAVEFNIQGAIDGVLELGYFKHIAGNGCKYCDYRTECKAGGYKALEKDSKKWFEIKPI